jgi:hypothetical protein
LLPRLYNSGSVTSPDWRWLEYVLTGLLRQRLEVSGSNGILELLDVGVVNLEAKLVKLALFYVQGLVIVLEEALKEPPEV